MIFAGCGVIAVNKIYGSVTFPGICITWGLIVMVMCYSVGHISGGHFNPAVTNWIYIVGPIVGAIGGATAYNFLRSIEKPHSELPLKNIVVV